MALYIIKKVNDLMYLESFDQTKKRIIFDFTPIKSDALMLPQNIAERYKDTINEIENNKICEVVPAK